MLRRTYCIGFVQEILSFKGVGEAWKAVTRNRGGHSAEHQGYVLKVVCFRSTSNAIFKEAMKEVKSWLH